MHAVLLIADRENVRAKRYIGEKSEEALGRLASSGAVPSGPKGRRRRHSEIGFRPMSREARAERQIAAQGLWRIIKLAEESLKASPGGGQLGWLVIASPPELCFLFPLLATLSPE